MPMLPNYIVLTNYINVNRRTEPSRCEVQCKQTECQLGMYVVSSYKHLFFCVKRVFIRLVCHMFNLAMKARLVLWDTCKVGSQFNDVCNSDRLFDM